MKYQNECLFLIRIVKNKINAIGIAWPENVIVSNYGIFFLMRKNLKKILDD